jgi:8-oxo-dGTP pyrophosphatase MutT (NUDIX family)
MTGQAEQTNGHGPLVDPGTLPDWLGPMVRATAGLDADVFREVAPVREGGRPAAVLMLLGDGEDPEYPGPDVLLLRRADTLGAHPGQVAFPGGRSDPDDDGPVGTALREAVEEVGIDVTGVRPVALLPKMFVWVSDYDVTPVLAHWERPSPVHAVDHAETAAVARVSIARLADPANRLSVRNPRRGFVSPAFLAPGMLIWGFTAGLLTMLLGIGGWDRPWDASNVRDLDDAWQTAMRLEGK